MYLKRPMSLIVAHITFHHKMFTAVSYRHSFLKCTVHKCFTMVWLYGLWCVFMDYTTAEASVSFSIPASSDFLSYKLYLKKANTNIAWYQF